MNEELKPCPFCGGEAGILTLGEVKAYRCFQIYCDDPDCYFNPEITGQNKQEVIKRWNTRQSFSKEEIEGLIQHTFSEYYDKGLTNTANRIRDRLLELLEIISSSPDKEGGEG